MAVDVAVSTVILALRADGPDGADGAVQPSAGRARELQLPLVHRTREPFGDRWALPGGWVGEDESLADAARRTLAETTGLRPSHLEQLYTFGAVDRSPTGRVVSVVYTALVREEEAAGARGEENVRWCPAEEAAAADAEAPLAFDHDEVVRYALWRLRTKVAYGSIAQAFLGERFTLAQLRGVHECVLGRCLDPANFRRQVEASGTVVATQEHLLGVSHRPPRLYRAAEPPGDSGGSGGAPGPPPSPYERGGPPA